MAAPHVAGVAALIKQKFPGITVGDLKAAIAQSADPMDNSAFYGHGFLNAAAAVAASTPELLASKPARVESAARVELTIARNGSAGAPELSFTLPSAGPAKVELFDVAGRKVAVLYDGQASAGRTTLSWAAGNSLHAGAYFARLTASGVQQAKQIVVLGQ